MRWPRALSVVILSAWAVASDAAPSALPPAIVLASDAKQPQATIAADGTVYVAWLQGGNVVVASSKDRGKSFGEAKVAIDGKGHARGGAQRGPRIGVDAKKTLVVTTPLTFDEAELQKKYPAPEVYLATSSDGGATWTEPARVNEVEKKAPEGLHAMRVAADGTVHVAWLDLRERKEKGQDLWYAHVVGGKVAKNVRVAETVCECCAPGLALDAAGNPLLAWREGGEKESRELFVTRSTDGGATFAAARRLNRENSNEDG